MYAFSMASVANAAGRVLGCGWKGVRQLCPADRLAQSINTFDNLVRPNNLVLVTTRPRNDHACTAQAQRHSALAPPEVRVQGEHEQERDKFRRLT
jgi:hypothetical protein